MVLCMNHQELSDSQWSFRSGRSTVTALLSVTQEWLSALECGQELCAVFFDYQKARNWKVLTLMAIYGAGSLTI